MYFTYDHVHVLYVYKVNHIPLNVLFTLTHTCTLYMYIQTCTCLGDTKTCWTVRQYNPHTLLPPHTGYRGVAGGLTLMPTYIPCAVTRNPGTDTALFKGLLKLCPFGQCHNAILLHLKCHMYNYNKLNRKHRLIH